MFWLVAVFAFSHLLDGSLAGTSYQHVSFISRRQEPPPSPPRNNHQQQRAPPFRPLPPQNGNGPRPVRSFGDVPHAFEYHIAVEEVWPESIFLNDNNLFDVTLDRPSGNLSPDYSGGLLDYEDPLLLTGPSAKVAATVLYGRGELFFQNIPHVRAMLRLQDQRRENGLPPNRLGSLNNQSPFYRNRAHQRVPSGQKGKSEAERNNS